MSNPQIHRWGLVCSIIVFAVFVTQFVSRLLAPRNLTDLSGLEKLHILLIGLAAAVTHGVLWSLAESTFTAAGFQGWSSGAGGASSMPQGWSAVTLSASMTVPLVLLPPLYARLIHKQVVPPGHALAACCVTSVGSRRPHISLWGEIDQPSRSQESHIPFGFTP